MVKIHIVEAGKFQLDGGAMFGVVPKQMWKKLNPPDDKNMCNWSMRSVLLEVGNRKILVDTGIGYKQGEKFRSHFSPHGQDIIASLEQIGTQPEEVTDVFLTHFHFDHVGGACKFDDQGKIVPTFPNATYWSNELHYQWAFEKNPREAASFLHENFVPLKDHGVLQMIDVQDDDVKWMDGIFVRFIHGHTKAQMILIIQTDQGKVVYPADLMPSQWHVRIPYIMAYDIQPLLTIDEKKRLLDEAIENQYRVLFEHDPVLSIGYVEKDDRGRYKIIPQQ